MILFKQYKDNLEYNDRDFEVTISVYLEDDYKPIPGDDFDFGNDEDNDQYLDMFDKEQMFSKTILVEVVVDRTKIEGSAFENGCLASSCNFDADIEQHIQEHDLVGQAKENLIKELEEVRELFGY